MGTGTVTYKTTQDRGDMNIVIVVGILEEGNGVAEEGHEGEG